MIESAECHFDRSKFSILKMAGIFPSGLNRLHDELERLNDELRSQNQNRPPLELLRSEYAKNENGYTVEIKVPYGTHADEYNGDRLIMGHAIMRLFNAVGAFPTV